MQEEGKPHEKVLHKEEGCGEDDCDVCQPEPSETPAATTEMSWETEPGWTQGIFTWFWLTQARL